MNSIQWKTFPYSMLVLCSHFLNDFKKAHTCTYVLATPKGASERDGGSRLRINLTLRKYLQSKCASFGIPSL